MNFRLQTDPERKRFAADFKKKLNSYAGYARVQFLYYLSILFFSRTEYFLFAAAPAKSFCPPEHITEINQGQQTEELTRYREYRGKIPYYS